ncbi:Wadjet anti-phage system protein JetD domain-containing protein [Rarobacter incanus]|uniref:Wadjet protein JetD C-terminal domain-containing protein n=1 Tax=Rarobacter incanus TaxID=153494 RepID=A0A542SP25_9MICO|nr:Wadjet anti-phage system protein JetD domain-containing protein [Rarobacter incanus]TQK76007.1 hypothetical protein FB389_0656 [Rarobacter incanus]
MSDRWTSPGDVAARVRRRWADGTLLRALARGDALDPIEVPLRGPRASEIGDDVAAVRAWIAAVEAGGRAGRRYDLVWGQIGGRNFGRNRVPTRAVVGSFDQAWDLLGEGAAIERFEAVLRVSRPHPAVFEWVVQHPLRALDVADEFRDIVAAYVWLDAHRGSARYLREISAPGVDTKFAERHRRVLAQMLGVSGAADGFIAELGLAARPGLVRMRVGAGVPGWPLGLSEAAVRTAELAQVPLAPARALIVENEVTYLSVPVPDDGVVLWGRGFDVAQAGSLPWLSGIEVRYWGDLDTAGFGILSRLRARVPHAESVLMDRATLLEHRARWVREPAPSRADLPWLTAAERALYSDLVSDRFGPAVRLEQELIGWQWVLAAL